MVQPFEDMQKAGKDSLDVAASSFSTVAKGFQAVAADSAEYAKRSFDSSSAAMERLLASKTVEQAIEVQSDYVRAAYEGLVSQSSRLGEMMTDIAREAYKPYESLFGKAMAR